ncbi:MAG: hypothetical protein ACR2MO_08405 [Acidimicrobiales bacterium]
MKLTDSVLEGMGQRLMQGVAIGVFVALVCAACTGDPSPEPPVATLPPESAEPPSSATSTSVAAAPDISAIPEVIDEAYVNAVLAALDEIDGQATRIIVSAKRVPDEALALLQAILSDKEYFIEAKERVDALARDPEMTGFLPNPGNKVTTVQRIIGASRSCVWLAVQRDYSKANVDPGPTTTDYLALVPLDRSNDPKEVNRTAWMILADGRTRDGSEPDNPCPGR